MSKVFDEFEAMYQRMIMSAANSAENDDRVDYKKKFTEDEDYETFTYGEDEEKSEEESSFEAGRQKGKIEDPGETINFKRYTKRHEHKYTESEMEEIRRNCMSTIVHDYGEHDVYHMSDKERAENDMLSEISLKIATLKSSYRKVNEYVEAMRIVMQAWAILEKHNYIHTREEFYEMVADGRIVSNRIIMPKLRRMNKYNIDLIIKYISNPELDANDLNPVKEIEKDSFYDQFLTDEEYEKQEEKDLERLLSEEDIKYIDDYYDEPERIEVKDIPYKYIKGYDRRQFLGKKKLSKKERYFVEGLHDILNKIQNNPANSEGMYSRSYLIANSLFDTEDQPKDFWDDKRFEGSWANKYDVELYDLMTREELLKEHPSDDRYLTYGDKELASFWNILEENGFNVMDLRGKVDKGSRSYEEEKSRVATKKNKKMEAEIAQRITKLNNNKEFKKLIGKAEDALNKFYNEQ